MNTRDERRVDLVQMALVLLPFVFLYAVGWLISGLSLMGDPLCPPAECPDMHAAMDLHRDLVVYGCVIAPAVVWIVTVVWSLVAHIRGREGASIARRGVLLAIVIWVLAFTARVLL